MVGLQRVTTDGCAVSSTTDLLMLGVIALRFILVSSGAIVCFAWRYRLRETEI